MSRKFLLHGNEQEPFNRQGTQRPARGSYFGDTTLVPRWRQAIAIVQPKTILRWHRLGFRLFWRLRTKSVAPPRVLAETIALIQDMAAKNRLWGAERIRGELLKLGISVSKRTIQKYLRTVRGTHPRGQSWATFLGNHGHAIWACDFVQTYDIFFRPVFLFFVVHLRSRRIVHMGRLAHLAWFEARESWA